MDDLDGSCSVRESDVRALVISLEHLQELAADGAVDLRAAGVPGPDPVAALESLRQRLVESRTAMVEEPDTYDTTVVWHELAFSDEDAAREIAGQLDGEVERPLKDATSPRWSVRVMGPGPQVIDFADRRAVLSDLAHEHGGEYEGWGGSVG